MRSRRRRLRRRTTTTSDKTLCGPRGGIILRKENAVGAIHAPPSASQGGPHMNVVAGIAVTSERRRPRDSRFTCGRFSRNAKVLAGWAPDRERGMSWSRTGMDNHMMVDTVASSDWTGEQPRTCSMRSPSPQTSRSFQTIRARRSGRAVFALGHRRLRCVAWENRNASYRRVHCGGSAGGRRRCGCCAPQVRVRRDVPSFSCSRRGCSCPDRTIGCGRRQSATWCENAERS